MFLLVLAWLTPRRHLFLAAAAVQASETPLCIHEIQDTAPHRVQRRNPRWFCKLIDTLWLFLSGSNDSVEISPMHTCGFFLMMLNTRFIDLGIFCFISNRFETTFLLAPQGLGLDLTELMTCSMMHASTVLLPGKTQTKRTWSQH